MHVCSVVYIWKKNIENETEEKKSVPIILKKRVNKKQTSFRTHTVRIGGRWREREREKNVEQATQHLCETTFIIFSYLINERLMLCASVRTRAHRSTCVFIATFGIYHQYGSILSGLFGIMKKMKTKSSYNEINIVPQLQSKSLLYSWTIAMHSFSIFSITARVRSCSLSLTQI